MEPYTYRILAKAAGLPKVEAGEEHLFPVERRLLYPWPALSDWFAQVLEQELGGRLPRPQEVYMTFDHMVPVKNAAQEKFIRESRAWASSKGIHVVEGEGIGHLLAIQEGWVKPGMVVPHFDTHVSSVGAIGALGVGLLKEMIYPLATGRLWLKIPPLLRIRLTGRLPQGVMGRDLLHALIGKLGLEQCGGKIVEFGGEGAAAMALDDRITVCNLANCLGAVSALFDPEGASWEEDGESLSFPLEELEPCLAAPPSTADIRPLSQAAGLPVDLGLIGTCAGGGLGDMAAAAHILAGKKLPARKALYVVPSTKRIYQEAIRLGYLQALAEAGCFISSPTCDFCYGAAAYLGEGRRAVSTQTLNVSGRLGSLAGEIWLGSSAAVAASLLRGVITDPREFWEGGEGR